MKLEEELREALREETRGWAAPPELKDRLFNHQSMKPGKKNEKWIAAGILAAVLLVPTGAYAGYHYLADSIYSSHEQMEQFGGTREQYDHLEEKLQAAKQSFEPQEFAKLMSLLKNWSIITCKWPMTKECCIPSGLARKIRKPIRSLTRSWSLILRS